MTKTTNHSAEFFAELEGDYAPFAGKPKRESRRPWHMHSEAERELVLMDLDAYSKRTGWTKRFAAAYQAAATLLREAAPWPDEALVVAGFIYQDEGRYELEIIDVDSTGCLCVVDEYGRNEHWRTPESCVPLTPAAAEFLAAMGGGGDE